MICRMLMIVLPDFEQIASLAMLKTWGCEVYLGFDAVELGFPKINLLYGSD